jgi:hypothetical protein
MTECREVARLRGAYLALELERSVEAEMRAHLAVCEVCRAELAAADPVASLALQLGALDVPEDPTFVSGVLAGIRQRRVEGRLVHRRRSAFAAAAALVIAILGGWALLRDRGVEHQAALAERTDAAAVAEPAFVEVEGKGVRLYQLGTAARDAAGRETLKVAFIVDPQLEL